MIARSGRITYVMSNCRRLGESCPIISNRFRTRTEFNFRILQTLLRKQKPDHEYEVLWDGQDQASDARPIRLKPAEYLNLNMFRFSTEVQLVTHMFYKY